MKTRLAVGFGVAALGSLTAFLAVVVLGTVSAKHRAEQLVRDVRSLDVSTASLEDVKRLAGKYPAPEVRYFSSSTQKECQISITIENSWVRHLRLAPRTSFQAFFDVEQGRLRYLQVGFEANRDPYPPLHARVWEMVPPRGEAAERTFWESCVGDPYGRNFKLVTAYILPSATPKEKEKAFTFNFECLQRIGGCEDHEFMPKICSGPKLPGEQPLTGDPREAPAPSQP